MVVKVGFLLQPSKAPKKPPPPVGKNIYPKLSDKASSFDDKPTSAKKDQGMSDLFVYSANYLCDKLILCVLT